MQNRPVYDGLSYVVGGAHLDYITHIYVSSINPNAAVIHNTAVFCCKQNVAPLFMSVNLNDIYINSV